MNILQKEFYNRSPLEVAVDLLGKIVVRKLDGQIITGRITETEAYLASSDEASHSFKGKTPRTQSLFLDAGHAYIHSMHTQNCFDIVTESIDVPSSVLIRALEPLEGIETMKKLRGKEELKDLTSGPGKLCKALSVTRSLDGIDLTKDNSELFIIDDGFVVQSVVKAKRIGISKAKEHEYRFYIKDNIYVSKK